MSDSIKHECGLAFIRLRKSFSYYQQQYGTSLWGLNKLYLLMEKQHNRGQDGAGVVAVKLNTEPGYPFMNRIRSNAPQAIADIFHRIGEQINEFEKYNPGVRNHPGLLKGHIDFMGEILLGHLRYLTQEYFSIEKATQLAAAFSYQQYTPSPLSLQPILEVWVNSLSGKNS